MRTPFHFKKKKLAVAIQVAIVMMLSACGLTGVQDQLADGYQLGDVTRGTVEDLKQVCNPENEALRNTARAAFEVATGRAFPVSLCVFANGEAIAGQAVGELTEDAMAMLCENADEAERVFARSAYELATGQRFPVPICEIYNGENIQQ